MDLRIRLVLVALTIANLGGVIRCAARWDAQNHSTFASVLLIIGIVVTVGSLLAAAGWINRLTGEGLWLNGMYWVGMALLVGLDTAWRWQGVGVVLVFVAAAFASFTVWLDLRERRLV